jgi:hypothetical protein
MMSLPMLSLPTLSPSMLSLAMLATRRMTVAIVLFAAGLGVAASPADARVFVGIGIPFPGFYPAPYYYPPPPVYYPPPVVYAPPQVYAPPPPAAVATGSGQSCYAGPYVCPMDRPVATGAGCYCPGNDGQRVWGRAN